MQYSEMREYPKVPGYYSDVYRAQIPPSRENWGGISGKSLTTYIYVTHAVFCLNFRWKQLFSKQRLQYQHQNLTWNSQHWTPTTTTRYTFQNFKFIFPALIIPLLPLEPTIKQLPPEHIVNYKSEKENPPHIQEKMAQDLKHSKEHMATTKTENETKKIKPKKPEHYPAVAAYKMADGYEPQDGVAETPSGAILSLTLGLIITCVMAVLIGCRLRIVRRRMRKCGKSYAHDADYLVNGMYL